LISLDIVILVGLLGLILGSFCNVVISRLPKMIEQEWEYEHAVLLMNKIQNNGHFHLNLTYL